MSSQTSQPVRNSNANTPTNFQISPVSATYDSARVCMALCAGVHTALQMARLNRMTGRKIACLSGKGMCRAWVAGNGRPGRGQRDTAHKTGACAQDRWSAKPASPRSWMNTRAHAECQLCAKSHRVPQDWHPLREFPALSAPRARHWPCALPSFASCPAGQTAGVHNT